MGKTNFGTTKVTTSVTAYIKAIMSLTNNEQQQFIYRGQPSSKFDVSSSAYREVCKMRGDTEINADDIKRYHQLLLEQAHKINSEEEKKLSSSPFELLAILQHGGAKTGLIDFSYNPLVALFFACQSNDVCRYEDGVVYYVKKSKFAIINDACTIENVFAHSDEWYNYILEPAALNTRILSQQGCFVIPNIGHIKGMILDKFIIPYKNKSDILKSLAHIGISEMTLFKDFYGFCNWGAESVKESFYFNSVISHLQLANTYLFINKLAMAEEEIEKAEKNLPHMNDYQQIEARLMYKLKGDIAIEKGMFECAIKNYELSIEKDKCSRIVPSADNFGRFVDIIEAINSSKTTEESLLLKRNEYAEIIIDFVDGNKNEKLANIPKGTSIRNIIDDIKQLNFDKKARSILARTK